VDHEYIVGTEGDHQLLVGLDHSSEPVLDDVASNWEAARFVNSSRRHFSSSFHADTTKSILRKSLNTCFYKSGNLEGKVDEREKSTQSDYVKRRLFEKISLRTEPTLSLITVINGVGDNQFCIWTTTAFEDEKNTR
jgi:hypothetical protein